MKFLSHIEERNPVSFPEFSGLRVYMRPFLQKEGLPDGLKHYQSVVDGMLDSVVTDQPIYIMIDESFVPAGQAQRRTGIHIDGYWNPGISAHGPRHGQSPSGHSPWPSGHRPTPSHGSIQEGSHRADINNALRKIRKKHSARENTWNTSSFSDPEGIILASTVQAAQGYAGEFDGVIGDGGDCSHIIVTDLKTIPMAANTVYVGNVTSLHETLPVLTDCYRQLVRLNVPGWSPEL